MSSSSKSFKSSPKSKILHSRIYVYFAFLMLLCCFPYEECMCNCEKIGFPDVSKEMLSSRVVDKTFCTI